MPVVLYSKCAMIGWATVFGFCREETCAFKSSFFICAKISFHCMYQKSAFLKGGKQEKPQSVPCYGLGVSWSNPDASVYDSWRNGLYVTANARTKVEGLVLKMAAIVFVAECTSFLIALVHRTELYASVSGGKKDLMQGATRLAY